MKILRVAVADCKAESSFEKNALFARRARGKPRESQFIVLTLSPGGISAWNCVFFFLLFFRELAEQQAIKMSIFGKFPTDVTPRIKKKKIDDKLSIIRVPKFSDRSIKASKINNPWKLKIETFLIKIQFFPDLGITRKYLFSRFSSVRNCSDFSLWKEKGFRRVSEFLEWVLMPGLWARACRIHGAHFRSFHFSW